MKYSKYILGIIVLLTFGFFALGLIKPNISYDCEILIDKPLAESWAVSQDQEKLSEWLPGFQKIEHISGTPGKVGAVSNVYFENNGEDMSIKEIITDIVPDESISMTYESDFMDMDYTLFMTDANGKTKISSTTVAEGNSIISKSMMALIGNSIKGQEEANLINLKRTIEENKKDYFRLNIELTETSTFDN